METFVAPNDIPRGIRNHNPGNVRSSPAFRWLGQVSVDSDGFVINSAPAFGLREIMVIFHNYQLFHGLKTTYQLIQRWAPSKENDTADYTRFVAGRLIVSPDQPLDMLEVWCRWTHAIVLYENGQDPYSIDIYNLAHNLAFSQR